MAHGAPDWTRQVQVVIVEGQPADERAAGGEGNYSGAAGAYQPLVSWTVAVGYVGELKEILVISDDYANTEVHIEIGGVAWCTDWNPTSAMPIIFEDLKLVGGTIVKVWAQSDDGTAIDVDAIIVAKEIVL